jgi:hypothetical protein
MSKKKKKKVNTGKIKQRIKDQKTKKKNTKVG